MDRSGYDSVKKDVEVLSVVDIRNKYQEVAWDMILAMLCLVPGIGIFCCGYLFHKYGCWCARPQPPGESGLEKLTHVLVWCMALLITPTRAITIYIHFRKWHQGTLELSTILVFWELYLLMDAIVLGASFGWLILSSQKDEIVQSVCEHKKKNKQFLMKNPRAGDLLDKLFHLFPQQFNEDIYKKDEMPLCSLQFCILVGSTMFMFLLMCAIPLLGKTNYINLYCTGEHKSKFKEWFCEEHAYHLTLPTWTWIDFELFIPKLNSNKLNSAFWSSFFPTVYLATWNWNHFIRGVLITTSVHMQENRRQLLLFASLTRSEEWNSRWSKQNRKALLDIVGGSFDGEITSASCRSLARSLEMYEDEEDDFKKRLRQTIEDDQVAKKHELDLGQEKDVEAWWLLRQYIQIDLLDEVVVAECCGVIIMILVFLFSLVALLDWWQNHQIFSAGLLLVSVLSSALLFAMWELFQACVAINTLWEGDDHTLVDAIVTSAMQGQSELKGLLESLQRKVLLSDARQELFGIRVTATLRNAWALSIGICILSTIWENVVKPFMKEADLEWLEDVFANWTNATN